MLTKFNYKNTNSNFNPNPNSPKILNLESQNPAQHRVSNCYNPIMVESNRAFDLIQRNQSEATRYSTLIPYDRGEVELKIGL